MFHWSRTSAYVIQGLEITKMTELSRCDPRNSTVFFCTASDVHPSFCLLRWTREFTQDSLAGFKSEARSKATSFQTEVLLNFNVRNRSSYPEDFLLHPYSGMLKYLIPSYISILVFVKSTHRQVWSNLVAAARAPSVSQGQRRTISSRAREISVVYRDAFAGS